MIKIIKLSVRQRRLADQVRRKKNYMKKKWESMHEAAFDYDKSIPYDEHPQLALGRMDKKCSHCNALKWSDEPDGLCCAAGKVKLDPIEMPPEPLRSLIENYEDNESRHFINHARYYNSAFQMTSFGADKIVQEYGK